MIAIEFKEDKNESLVERLRKIIKHAEKAIECLECPDWSDNVSKSTHDDSDSKMDVHSRY